MQISTPPNLKFYSAPQKGLEFIFLKNFSFKYPEHTHNSSYIINAVLSGAIQLEKNAQQTTYKTDEIFLINPGEAHRMIINSSCVLLSVCLNKLFLKNYDLAKAKPIILGHLKYLSADNQISVKNLTVIISFLEKIYNQKKVAVSHQEVEKIKSAFQKRPAAKTNLAQLAKTMNKFHLIRTFKKFTGLTPHKFQIQSRVRQAQHSILNSSSLTEAALNAGFYDQSHFIKNFKRLLGIKPSAYKLSCFKLPNNYWRYHLQDDLAEFSVLISMLPKQNHFSGKTLKRSTQSWPKFGKHTQAFIARLYFMPGFRLKNRNHPGPVFYFQTII